MPLPEQDVVPPSARPQQVDLLRLHEELPVDVPREVVAELDGAQRGAARDLVVDAKLGFQLVDYTGNGLQDEGNNGPIELQTSPSGCTSPFDINELGSTGCCC